MAHPTDRPITRRRGLLGLGALGAAGALAATGCAGVGTTTGQGSAASSTGSPTSPAASSPAPQAGILPLEEGKDAVVRAAMTTAWLEPGRTRGWTDEPISQGDPHPEAWLSRMDWAQQQWLLGKTDTQAALGSRVTVRALTDSWAKVSFLDQAAPNEWERQTSWVPRAHVVRDTGFIAAQEGKEVARVTADQATVYADAGLTDSLLLIPFGTRLPLLESGEETTRVLLPDEREGWLPSSAIAVGEPALGTVEDVIATAKSFHGRPYLWAGMSPFGFDCSGFTYTVLRSHGILLPRDAGPQLNSSGLPKVSADDLTPGDLLFYSHVPGGSRIRHVALYIGKGYGIHSPAVGRTVEVQTLKNINSKRDYAGAVRPQYATA